MEKLPDLSSLSPEAKDALIMALWEEVLQMRRRVRDQERPKKTSKNSSKRPSEGFKPNKANRGKGGERRAASVGRAGGGRRLSESYDRRVEARLSHCPKCQADLPSSSHRLHSRYDKLELPDIRPIVTRVERYSSECECCGHQAIAPVPDALSGGSPYGESIEALVSYLRYGHAISYQRLHELLGEVFNLSISEGALANLLARVK